MKLFLFLAKNFAINTSSVIIILESIESGNFQIAKFLIRNFEFKESFRGIIKRLITNDEISRVKFAIIDKPKEKLETDSSDDGQLYVETFSKCNENSSSDEFFKDDHSSYESSLNEQSNDAVTKEKSLEDESEDESENESIDINFIHYLCQLFQLNHVNALNQINLFHNVLGHVHFYQIEFPK